MSLQSNSYQFERDHKSISVSVHESKEGNTVIKGKYIFINIKYKIIDQDKNEIIYRIKLKSCDAQYIGETDNELNKRSC